MKPPVFTVGTYNMYRERFDFSFEGYLASVDLLYKMLLAKINLPFRCFFSLVQGDSGLSLCIWSLEAF